MFTPVDYNNNKKTLSDLNSSRSTTQTASLASLLSNISFDSSSEHKQSKLPYHDSSNYYLPSMLTAIDYPDHPHEPLDPVYDSEYHHHMTIEASAEASIFIIPPQPEGQRRTIEFLSAAICDLACDDRDTCSILHLPLTHFQENGVMKAEDLKTDDIENVDTQQSERVRRISGVVNAEPKINSNKRLPITRTRTMSLYELHGPKVETIDQHCFK